MQRNPITPRFLWKNFPIFLNTIQNSIVDNLLQINLISYDYQKARYFHYVFPIIIIICCFLNKSSLIIYL